MNEGWQPSLPHWVYGVHSPAIGLVVAFPRLLRPVQTEPAGEGSALWRRTLRLAISIIVLPALSMAIIFTLVRVIAQSDQWDLPGGRLLDAILSSCQFEHSSEAGVDVEHMICPTRLGASEFPQVLKNAVSPAKTSASFRMAPSISRPPLRAAWHFSLGDRQGGSTITQQLARSILLKKEDSLERKLIEAVLAIRIYARLSRSEILTRYMNVVPHARNMYGFDDPARYYFGVGVQDLTLARGGAPRRHAA